MKKFYFLLFVYALALVSLHAQISDAWKDEIESVFENVDRSLVTTGLLTDYGIYFTNIDKFNGIPCDTNYIELTEWQSLYLSLYTCRFNTNASMPDPVEVFELIDTLAKQNSGIILPKSLPAAFQCPPL